MNYIKLALLSIFLATSGMAKNSVITEEQKAELSESIKTYKESLIFNNEDILFAAHALMLSGTHGAADLACAVGLLIESKKKWQEEMHIELEDITPYYEKKLDELQCIFDANDTLSKFYKEGIENVKKMACEKRTETELHNKLLSERMKKFVQDKNCAEGDISFIGQVLKLSDLRSSKKLGQFIEEEVKKNGWIISRGPALENVATIYEKKLEDLACLFDINPSMKNYYDSFIYNILKLSQIKKMEIESAEKKNEEIKKSFSTNDRVLLGCYLAELRIEFIEQSYDLDSCMLLKNNYGAAEKDIEWATQKIEELIPKYKEYTQKAETYKYNMELSVEQIKEKILELRKIRDENKGQILEIQKKIGKVNAHGQMYR